MKHLWLGVAASALMIGTSAMGQVNEVDPAHDLSKIAEFTIQHFDLPAEAGQPIVVGLTLDGEAQRLELRPQSVRGDRFVLIVVGEDNVERQVEPPPSVTYRGHLDGVPGSDAGLSLIDGQLHGILLVPSRDPADELVWWSIDPLTLYMPDAPRTAHVVYKARDLPAIPGFCGLVDQALPFQVQAGRGEGTDNPDQMLVCELAIDSDVQFYTLSGSNQQTATNNIETIINGVNVIYQRDVEVQMQIVHVIIRTTAGPYTTTTNANTILNQFANHWATSQGSVHRDLAHMVSGKTFSGSTIGIAFLSGVCSFSNGYGLIQYPGLSTAFRIAVSAHEIGHNFSAPHCDGDPTCGIMCSGLGGCNGIITSFGATEKSRIRGYAIGRSCLSPLIPPVLPLPFFDDFPSTTLDTGKWEFATLAGVNGTAVNPISPPYTLAFNNVSSVTSKELDVAQVLYAGRVFASWWTQHRFVEAGKRMDVEYFSPFLNSWRPLKTHVSDGVNQTRFYPHEVELPADAHGTRFRIRFTSQGNDGLDLWYVDDVYVGIHCRVDINKDRQLDIFDFLDFSNLFAIGADIADWDRSGTHDIFDFLAFSNSFSAGCYPQ